MHIPGHESIARRLRPVGSDLGRLGAAGLYLSMAVGLPPAAALLTASGWWLRPSVEVVALAGALALLAAIGRPPGPVARAGLAAVVLALTLLAAADLAVHTVYGRPLNLAADLAYVPFMAGFLAESVGGGRAAAAAAAGLVAAAALFAANLWALRHLGGVVARARGRRVLAGLAAVVVATQAVRADTGAGCPAGSGLACRPWQLAGDQLGNALDLWRPLPGLDDAADPYADPVPGRLAGLDGADVVLAFVESYGETVFRRPDYAAVVGPALAEVEAALAAGGLSAASGYLVSPTVGGVSWLAHGTLLAGVWLENDLYYKRLLRGGRTTLVEDFNRAGYRTLGVFPQINRPWPEGSFFRYHNVYTGENIPYAGPPFGWTTMPDQYSLWFVERERRRSETPVFAEIALISSHAPWEPIPPFVEDWGSLGDGEAFAGMADAGGPENWPHDATANYPKSIAYTLRALGSWAANFLTEERDGGGGMLIMVGDHQPASLITGEGASRAVPIHMIASDPALLEPFRAWGFTPGMVPAHDASTHRMDAFRARFHDAYGPDGGGPAAVAGAEPG